MKVLVTGSRGFIGSNLCAALRNVRDGKDRREFVAPLKSLTILEYTRQTDACQLEEWCSSCDFVIHLAGANRPDDDREFDKVNVGLLAEMIGHLERVGNVCPIVLASSVQASLTGRYAESPYGASKQRAEALLDAHVNASSAASAGRIFAVRVVVFPTDTDAAALLIVTLSTAAATP